MRQAILSVALTILVVCTGRLLWAGDDKPAEQSDAKPAEAAVKAPTPNTSDEPLAARFSAQKAAEFLDQVSLAWTTERKCGSCHTNYAYMLAQPAFGMTPSPAALEVRKFFEGRAANWDTAKPRWDTEVVATAVTLAIHDAQTTGKLHSTTRAALDRMWTLQQEDGAWNWLKCDWPFTFCAEWACHRTAMPYTAASCGSSRANASPAAGSRDR